MRRRRSISASSGTSMRKGRIAPAVVVPEVAVFVVSVAVIVASLESIDTVGTAGPARPRGDSRDVVDPLSTAGPAPAPAGSRVGPLGSVPKRRRPDALLLVLRPTSRLVAT